MRRILLAVAAVIAGMMTAPGAIAAPPQAAGATGATSPGPAAPQDADEATRNAARKIAEEGLSLFQGGQYAEALDRFERAGALVRAPTMGLMAGRSLVKLGRLVEASERFLAVTRMTLAKDASDAFRKAQVDAGKEREAPLTDCAGTCVDLASDPGNCGECGNACAGTCQGGACLTGLSGCGVGYILCNDVCVDPTSDPNHCGECNNACAGACQSGGCIADPGPCGAGQSVCPDGCRNLQLDHDNCGECGNGCGALQCVNGGCQ